jgi:hypothetical protein
MKQPILFALMLCTAAASHAATSTEYPGRCVYSKLGATAAERKVAYDGACTINVGLIGSGGQDYHGPIIQYSLKAGTNQERSIRVWAKGVAIMDGVPAKEITTKPPKGKAPVAFVSVEGEDVRFTAPPADAF